MQIIETQDRDAYTRFVTGHGGGILQSWQWGEFQRKLNRKVWRLLLATNSGKHLAAATIIKNPLAQGKSYFYCPRGPVLAASPNPEKVWQLLLDKIDDLVISERPVFLRCDPESSDPAIAEQLLGHGFRKLDWEIQPKDTNIVDLTGDEADVLHRMKPKARYNIHLAARRGVIIEHFRDGGRMKDFWELMRQTSHRDGFAPHPYLYYFNLMETLGRLSAAELVLATYQRRPLAGAIVSYFGDTATYLHGASSDRFRQVMAPYAVQWAAMLGARARGCARYDLGGVSPEVADEKHDWAGISRFKRGFGGKDVSYIGAFDRAYDRLWYRIYRMGRWIRRRLG